MATSEQLIKRLREVHLFSGLDRPELRVLASIVQRVEHTAGQLIYRQGEPGTRYYIVEQGTLRFTRVDPEGRILEILQLGAEAAFGETSLLLGDVRDATVEALQDCVLLFIERDDFAQFLEQVPEAERKLRMRPEVKERRAYPPLPWVEEGELPVKILHKHSAVLVTALLFPATIGVILVLGGILAAIRWQSWALALGLGLALLPALICLYLYVDWRNDRYIVTTRRVCHWERIGLFRENLSIAPLDAIQNINQVKVGMVAGLLDYGDLTMEMTGEGGQVVFRSIPRPAEVQEIIIAQIDRTRAGMRAQERTAIRQTMRRHFSGKPDGEDQEKAPPKAPEPAQRPGCLALLPRLIRSFLPPSWHREGSTITWRKHWVALVQPAGPPLSLFVLATAAVIFVTVQYVDQTELVGAVLLPYAVAILIVLPWFLWQFENWQNDFYQVTATRLIHVERLPFYLREEQRMAPLDRITNVRYEQSALGKFLRYGDVFVETSGLIGDFYLRWVSRPRDVQTEIFAHMSAYRSQLQRQEAERRRSELLDWFSVYDEFQGTRPSPSDQPPDHKEQS